MKRSGYKTAWVLTYLFLVLFLIILLLTLIIIPTFRFVGLNNRFTREATLAGLYNKGQKHVLELAPINCKLSSLSQIKEHCIYFRIKSFNCMQTMKEILLFKTFEHLQTIVSVTIVFYFFLKKI